MYIHNIYIYIIYLYIYIYILSIYIYILSIYICMTYIYIYIYIILYIMYFFNACRRPRSLEQSGKFGTKYHVISCCIYSIWSYIYIYYMYVWSYPLMVSHFRFHGDFGDLLHRSSLLTTQKLVALTLRLCQQLAIENGHRNSGFTHE